MQNIIYHITTKENWEQAKIIGELVEDSLEKVGFIHCSYPRQLLFMANNKYKGTENLLLLCINREIVK